MRTLLILAVAIALNAGNVKADDQEIKDFIKFEQTKLKTYAEATEQYKTDKKPVIVWVGIADFELWKRLKAHGNQVFVKEFPGIKMGVVIGGEYQGQFARLRDIPIASDAAEDQRKLFQNKIDEVLNPRVAQSPPPVQQFNYGFDPNCTGSS